MEKISSDFDLPIVFRTAEPIVYESSIREGSIWLRSSAYYRNLEDEARKDRAEGVNGTTTLLPLLFKPEKGARVKIEGPGSVGCEIINHYLVSLHGSSISEKVRQEFGGCTFGIKNIDKLSAEILYQVSKQYLVKGYRYGQVSYQYTALSLSQSPSRSALCLNGEPNEYVKSINTDVLRKEPVYPFIEQDEWRIAIFLDEFINNDASAPLKINVDPDNFYEYMPPIK